MIGIQTIVSSIGGARADVRSLAEYTALQAEERAYYESCGIDSVYIAESSGGFDIALDAARQILAQTGTMPEDLDAIIHIKSRVPERFISSEATRMQYELGADRAICFGMADLGCADSSMALKLARDMLTANRRWRSILICYGHKQYAASRYRHPVTIQGDGGFAMLIGKSERNMLLDIEIETNGAYWDLFSIPFRDTIFDAYAEECSDVRKYGFELAIESKNRFKDINDRLLERNNLTYSDIDHFLLQNISSRAFEYYENAFDISISPVCKHNLAQYGHLGCADVFLNYDAGLASGMFQQGQKALVMNNSPVAAWSSFLLEL